MPMFVINRIPATIIFLLRVNNNLFDNYLSMTHVKIEYAVAISVSVAKITVSVIIKIMLITVWNSWAVVLSK